MGSGLDGGAAPGGFLALIDEPERGRLLASACLARYPSGASILAEADPSGPVFIMLCGRACVMTYGEDGRVVSHRDIGPGDLFGEIAALDGAPRSANVVAETDCDVARIEGGTFAELTSREPAFARALTRHLAQQLRILSIRVVELSTLLVRERLARELARRATRALSGDAWVIRPAPKHADLAARIGTHREAVTKELGRLARSGVLTRDRDGFAFKSPDDLIS